MDRQIVYAGSIPLDTDVLHSQQNTMVALGFLAQAMAGTSSAVDGLACAPTNPASLSVTVGPGSVFQQATIEASPYGALPADTADNLVKCGINIAPTVFTFTPPAIAGQSQSFVIQAQLNEVDDLPVSLPYYNSANPSVPFSGPNNSGAAQNTRRRQTVALQVIAGAAANAGSQQVPAVTAGWVPVWIVNTNNGQSQITATSIVRHPSAPFLDAGQSGRGISSGRRIAHQIIDAVGPNVFAQVVPGAGGYMIEAVGGGGSGGSCPATSGSTASAAGGAGGGAFARVWVTAAQFLAASTAQGVPVSVGAGGAVPAANAAGNAGGTTTVGGTLLVCPGGNAGLTTNATPSGYTGGGPSSNQPTTSLPGAQMLEAVAGAAGGVGIIISPSSTISGVGGSSRWGTGGDLTNGTAALTGNNGSGKGSGGSGAACIANGPGAQGGAGMPGRIIVTAYS